MVGKLVHHKLLSPLWITLKDLSLTNEMKCLHHLYRELTAANVPMFLDQYVFWLALCIGPCLGEGLRVHVPQAADRSKGLQG